MRLSLLMLLCALRAWTADVYVAMVAAGADTGADAANAHSVAWLNNAPNWASSIAPGDTVHLCGRFDFETNSIGISALGSGTAGNPITILWEMGAVLSSARFGAGGVMLTNCSYVDLDGGASGVVQNTNNGSALSFGTNSTGIYLSQVSYVNVRRLTVTNIYANNPTFATNSVDIGGRNTKCVHAVGDMEHVRIYSNDLSGAKSGILVEFDSAVIDTLEIDHNFIHDHCWKIAMGNGATGSVANSVSIHDNIMTDWSHWFYPGGSSYPPDVYHTDGIIAYTSSNCPAFAPAIYNNYFYGDLGNASPTAFVYLTYGLGSVGNNILTSGLVYNNLMVFTNRHYWAIGLGSATTNHQIYNNTIIGVGNSNYTAMVISAYGTKIKNNVVVGFQRLIGSYADYLTNCIAECDTNCYFGVGTMAAGNPFSEDDGARYFSMASWRALGYDVNSITNDPALSASYTLTSVSPAIGAGAVLSDIFTTDKAGTIRGLSWDMGAYEYVPPGPRRLNIGHLRAGKVRGP